jgi:rhodanese-related sulfurtransferase
MGRNEQRTAVTEVEETAGGLSRRQLLLALGCFGVSAVGATYWWRSQPVAHDHQRLTPAEAFAAVRSGQITLIDIRTPREWRQTGVPVGAIPIDMRRRDFLQALKEAVAGDLAAPVALICARGVRSARMTRALAAAGHSAIVDVPEGMLGSASGPGWLAGNLPVTRWQG